MWDEIKDRNYDNIDPYYRPDEGYDGYRDISGQYQDGVEDKGVEEPLVPTNDREERTLHITGTIFMHRTPKGSPKKC